MGHNSGAGSASHDTNDVDVDSDDLREIIAAVQYAEVTARQCHEENERTRAKLQHTSVADEKSLQNYRVSGCTYSSDDGASSVEFDRELRAAAKREEAQFQNLRNKRAALEEKLQKLSISLREDCRIAKRVRYQLTDKVWSWLNSAFMDQIPSMGVHLGPDHIDTVGTAEPSEAAMSDRSLAGNASLHTGDEDTLDCKDGEQVASEVVEVERTLSAAEPATRPPGQVAPLGPPSSAAPIAVPIVPAPPEPHAADGMGGKRKAPSAAATMQMHHLRWLAQAEAAQAVLQSSHKALDEWHQLSAVAGKPSDQPDTRSGSLGGEPGPSSMSGAAEGGLSKSLGGAFTMGHHQPKPGNDS
eukprot:jgi/Tetstr1/433136/TSEL_022468.t1